MCRTRSPRSVRPTRKKRGGWTAAPKEVGRNARSRAERVYATSTQCPAEWTYGHVSRLWDFADGGFGRPDAPVRARVQPYARPLGRQKRTRQRTNSPASEPDFPFGEGFGW